MVVRLGRKISVLCTHLHQKTEKNVIKPRTQQISFQPSAFNAHQSARIPRTRSPQRPQARISWRQDCRYGRGATHIVANIVGELYACLKYKNCQVLPSDMLLKLPDCEKYVYPDVMIVCETPLLDDENRQGLEVLLNPTVVIEVTSPSTGLFDRTEKMECYLLLASLQQYVLVDSEKVDVITYTRNPQNQWIMQYFTQKADKVTVGDCELLLEDMYRKTGK